MGRARPGTIHSTKGYRIGRREIGTLVLALMAASAIFLFALVASASPGIGSAGPAWGPDIQVNPEPSHTPSNYKNHVIAINPTNPQNIVAGYDRFDWDHSWPAYAASTDGGHTWATNTFSGTWGSAGYIPIPGETTMVFDSAGTGYYTGLALSSTVSTALFILTTTNGLDWHTPVPVVIQNQDDYIDGVTLAVDRHTHIDNPNPDTLYAFWAYSNNTDPFWQGIRSRRSTDGGITWSADAQVSDPNHTYSFGPSAVVASDGTVYAGFEYKPNNILVEPRELYLDRSTDGGQTWGQDHIIGGGPITMAGGPDPKYHEMVLGMKSSCNLVRINHFPQIAVSPVDTNTVYAVWNDGRWEPDYKICGSIGKYSDISFSKTTDGGTTWSTPARLNDDPPGAAIDQFQPSIATAPNGTIGVTWYDRRYETEKDWYDLVYSQSTDAGTTWSANVRVTDVSSNPDQLQDFKLVDDLGIRKSLTFSPDGSFAIASWIDARHGVRNGDFYVDVGSIENTPTPTVTLIPTLTSTSTPTHTTAPAESPSATWTSTNTPAASSTGTSTNTPTASGTSTYTATATPTTCRILFADVPEGSTFYTFVKCLSCLGIVTGYPCGGPGEPCNGSHDPYFRPGISVTRGQLAKVVANAAGFSEPVSGQSFEDVPPGATFYTFVQRLAGRAAMSGYPCGGPGEPCAAGSLPYFRPNNNSTRGQITKIVALAANINDPPGTQVFEDVAPGSTFFTYTQQLADRQVISGYPCGQPEPCIPPSTLPYFRPNSNTTRGQVSKIVQTSFLAGCEP